MSSATERRVSPFNSPRDPFIPKPGEPVRDIRDMSRAQIYRLPAIVIRPDRDQPAHLTVRQADALFERLIPHIHSCKLSEKRQYFRQLVHAAKRAAYLRTCIRYPRMLAHPECSRLRMQVADAAAELGLFESIRSPRGSPQMSRLIVGEELKALADNDPYSFDPRTSAQLVFLYKRHTEPREELPLDTDHPLVRKTTRRLRKINSIHDHFYITTMRLSEWERGCWDEERQRIRPFHFRVFTDDLNHHGRIYSDEYGHQRLRKEERATIQFNDEASVELDYSGLHARMLYHQEGIDYQDDPYMVLGAHTSGPIRLMVKVLVNALINADTPNAAIRACNLSMSTKHPDGSWKEGKQWTDAERLRKAARVAKTSFKQLLPIVMGRHERIAHHFGTDAGLRLMRVDSDIALGVMYHFARHGVPCLGVHDSFVVPVSQRAELLRAMSSVYELHLGFLPVVKSAQR